MRSIVIITLTLLSITVSMIVRAEGDLAAGEKKAQICAACHGSDGISINDLWPNLAAQKYGYLKKQITAFRDKTRHDPLMYPMVQSLSDQDIKDIAAYYSNLDGSETQRATMH